MTARRGNELEDLQRDHNEVGNVMGDYYGVPLTRREIHALEVLAEVLGEPIPPRTAAEWPSSDDMLEILWHTGSEDNFVEVVPLGVRIEGGHVVEMITKHQQRDPQQRDHDDFSPLHPEIGTLRWLTVFNDHDLQLHYPGFDTLPDPERYALLELVHNMYFDKDSWEETTIFGGHLIEIGLFRIQLPIMPESIVNFRHLKKLTLHYTFIHHLPDSIGSLQDLEKIDISIFWLERLPESIGSLQNLKYLKLDQHRRPWGQQDRGFHMPPTMLNVQQLETLTLTRCGLDSAPNFIPQLQNLKELNLNENLIREISQGFFKRLSNLTHLNLSENDFHALPSAICDLTNLIHLNISKNHLGGLPECLGKMENIQELNLSDNDEIFIGNYEKIFLQLSDLRILNLKNCIRTIPIFLYRVPSFCDIILSKNVLEQLEEGYETISRRITQNEPLGWLARHHPLLSKWAPLLEEICTEHMVKHPDKSQTAEEIRNILHLLNQFVENETDRNQIWLR